MLFSDITDKHAFYIMTKRDKHAFSDITDKHAFFIYMLFVVEKAMTRKGVVHSTNEDGTGPATFQREKPCVRCGSHEFLVSTRRCRPCNRRWVKQSQSNSVERERLRGSPCAICELPMEQPCFDEVDGTLRAWLCHNCNIALGHMHHSVVKIRRMLAYVEGFEPVKVTPRRSAAERRARLRR